MYKNRLMVLLLALILSFSIAGITLAADTTNQGTGNNSTESDTETIQATINATQSDMVVPFEGTVTLSQAGPAGSMGPAGFIRPDSVLWDNGPLVTHPGGGAGGADASALQSALGMNMYGFGHQVTAGNRVADEFTITNPGGWQIDQITFFAYQTYSGTTCSIDQVNYQIWDGPPDDPGSSVVYGDTSTNRLVSCLWSNIYRVLDTALANTDRPIMADVAAAGIVLPAGTYWLDWQTGGTLSSGPWASPISIMGSATTGNALQWSDGAWQPASDSGTGTQQGLPFIIEGSIMAPPGIVLTPDAYEKSTCQDEDVTYTFDLANNTGANGTFSLAYTAYWAVSGPSQVTVADGASANFNVVVSIPCGGVSDVATVTATGNGHSDQVELTTSSSEGVTDWESISPINGEGRSRPAAAPVNGKIYLIGGEKPGGLKANTVEEFNPATGLWTTKAGLMPTPVSNICAAAIGTDIYIPGGYTDSDVFTDQLQVYHTSTDSWETIVTDPLPAPRGAIGCVALNGKLYAFGGTDDLTFYSSTYVYDPTAAAGSRWTTLQSMNYARGYTAGAVVNGLIYAVGGRDGSTSDFAYVEAYDPTANIWHVVTPMNTARGGPGAFTLNNLLLVCGGGWSTYLNSCEVYNTAYGFGGSWLMMDQVMISARRTFAYASLLTGLYAMAGFNGDFMTSAERLPVINCPACDPPGISIFPSALLTAQPTNVVTTHPLNVCNEGRSLLNWALKETPYLENIPISIPPSDGNFIRGNELVSTGSAPRAVAGELLADQGLNLVGEPAYAIRHYPGDPELVNFPNISNPGIWNVVAPKNGWHFFAGEFNNADFSKLYVLDYDLNNLYSVETTNGLVTLVGPSTPFGSEDWTGMTESPNGVMYASSTDIIRSTLYTLNLSTGAATMIGEITNAPAIIDIAINAAGEIYGVDIVNDTLVRINRTTGEGTVVGSIGFDANFAQGMDFEETTGTLYMAAFNGGAFRGELRVVDTSTGNTALVGPFPLGSQVDAFTFATNPGPPILWLRENPGAGTAGPNKCQAVDITFDSNGLPNGTYLAELEIFSNDPSGLTEVVPVTLEVGFYRQFLPHAQRH